MQGRPVRRVAPEKADWTHCGGKTPCHIRCIERSWIPEARPSGVHLHDGLKRRAPLVGQLAKPRLQLQLAGSGAFGRGKGSELSLAAIELHFERFERLHQMSVDP